MMRAWALLLLLVSFPAASHDLITAEAAERYLSEASRLRALLTSTSPAAQRAEASYRMGTMLDEIREFLNRDLAAHGEVQGLPSNYLVSQLERTGLPLAFSPAQKRYLSNIRYFSEALRLTSSGPVADQAAYRLLLGRFYYIFEADPVVAAESWKTLQDQIALGERLRGKGLSPEEQEEADFILAVCYVRAAIRAPDSSATGEWAAKARAAMEHFERRYPESLRTAAMPLLQERLRRDHRD